VLELSETDLLSRLRNFEDNFAERKRSSDKREWLETAVAFANSVPLGLAGVLFIGVKNDGTIQGIANLDKLQQTFS
jgi:predicted HTH transcriptional regulator